MGITKTDFIRGLQCKKMLWLDSHRPELKQIPEETRKRLDEGNAFGDGAMGIFGEYTETTVFRDDGSGRLDYAAMIEKTKECLGRGVAVVCEAAFSWRGNYCAADILRKTENGYELYEVKNATRPRKEFLLDLGFQSLILRRCGVELAGRFLVLNDGAGGYKIADETAAVRLAERTAEKNLFALGQVKRAAEEPCVATGRQCDEPYRCWYSEYCRGREAGGALSGAGGEARKASAGESRTDGKSGDFGKETENF